MPANEGNKDKEIKQTAKATAGGIYRPGGKQLTRSSLYVLGYASGISILLGSLFACSLSEEMKRIEASKEYEEKQDASRSTELTGEQVFIRSCNTCHPGGKQGMGPSLLNISQKFPEDEILKEFIRKGRGIMPAQPESVIDDNELDRLVTYLRTLH